MVVPAFGFSVGDFIAAIKLINKSARALRQADGAPAQYQRAVQELSMFEALLQKVQQLEETGQQSATIDKLRLCSFQCHIPLSRFIERLRELQPYLGTRSESSGKSLLSRKGRMIKWTVALEQDLAELKADILPMILTSDTLLQISTLEYSAANEKLLEENLKLAKQTLGKVEDLKTTIYKETVTRAQSETLLSLMRDIDTRVQDSKTENLRTQAKLEAQESILRNFLVDFRAIHDGTTKASQTCRAPWTDSLVCTRYTEDDSFISGDERITGSYKDWSVYQLQQLTRSIRAGSNEALLLVLFLLPDCERFLRSLSVVARPLITSKADCIQFEDALGRPMDLPFEYFQHQPVLEQYLLCKFDHLPGELKVKRKEFDIVASRRGGRLSVTTARWKRLVHPGAVLLMSFEMNELDFDPESCPRCAFETTVQAYDKERQCDCGLEYRLLEAQWQSTTSKEADVTPSRETFTWFGPADTDYKSSVAPAVENDVADEHHEDNDLRHFKRIHLSGMTRQGRNRSFLESQLSRHSRDQKTLKVRHLPQGFTQATLRDIFASYGCLDTNIIRNGEPLENYGYVTFNKSSQLSRAVIDLNGTIKHGWRVELTIASKRYFREIEAEFEEVGKSPKYADATDAPTEPDYDNLRDAVEESDSTGNNRADASFEAPPIGGQLQSHYSSTGADAGSSGERATERRRTPAPELSVQIHYEGFILERLDPDPGENSTWASMHLGNEQLQKIVKARRQATGKSPQSHLRLLSPNQQGVIHRLLAKQQCSEKDKRAEWVLASVKPVYKGMWSKEVKELQIILKRLEKSQDKEHSHAESRAYEQFDVIDVEEHWRPTENSSKPTSFHDNHDIRQARSSEDFDYVNKRNGLGIGNTLRMPPSPQLPPHVQGGYHHQHNDNLPPPRPPKPLGYA